MFRLSSYGLCLLIAFMLTSNSYSQSNFPVPRAESEFRSLVVSLIPRAQDFRGDANQFVEQAMSFGLYDLQTLKASSTEAATLRNYYLGVMGSAAQVNAANLANRFHCGPPCAENRLKHLTGLLSAIDEAASAFRKINRLTVVTLHETGHRLGGYFHLDGRYYEAVASPIMGFIPSGNWLLTEDDQVLERLGLTEVSRDNLFDLMRAADLVAMVAAEDGSTRAIWAGIGDNEAGLLFLQKSSPKPVMGALISGAGIIVALERVREGVYFYTTT